MALILNIETATRVCSVALAKDGKVVSMREDTEGRSHAEMLTVFIEEAVREAGISFSGLDAVAVSKGPGSYTGLRIGVSAAKGLCCALNKPLVAINTLKALCIRAISLMLNEHGEALLCPMIDARRMEVYCAIYDSALNEIKSTSAEIITDSSFSGHLEKGKMIFFGDGAMKCREAIRHPDALFIENVLPSASALALLSYTKYENKEFEDAAYFEPFYLKDFVAGKPKKSI